MPNTVNPSSKAAESENPYLKLEKGWSDQLARERHKNAASLISVVVLAVALTISVLANLYLAVFREPTPYVLEIDEYNRVNFGGFLSTGNDIEEAYIPSQLIRFIENWRTVTPDNTMQKKLAKQLYCMLPDGSASLASMNGYFRKSENNPFNLNKTHSISTTLNSVLPQTRQTWQIEWTETIRAHDGSQHKKPMRYKALMLVKKGKPGPECMEGNPLGLYVSEINWTTVI